MRFGMCFEIILNKKWLFSCRNTTNYSCTQVQLGPRYEGQLNPMAEPIPHEVRPLVRTHVYHPNHAVDRQAETDSWV